MGSSNKRQAGEGGGGRPTLAARKSGALSNGLKTRKPASDHRRHALHLGPESSDKTPATHSTVYTMQTLGCASAGGGRLRLHGRRDESCCSSRIISSKLTNNKELPSMLASGASLLRRELAGVSQASRLTAGEGRRGASYLLKSLRLARKPLISSLAGEASIHSTCQKPGAHSESVSEPDQEVGPRSHRLKLSYVLNRRASPVHAELSQHAHRLKHHINRNDRDTISTFCIFTARCERESKCQLRCNDVPSLGHGHGKHKLLTKIAIWPHAITQPQAAAIHLNSC